MAGGFLAALCVAAAVLALAGTDERGTIAALRATARVSFLLFWPAYAGAGAATLVGPRLGWMKRYGRELGLSFAAAHLVHIGLIAWLCRIGKAPSTEVFIVFGIGLLYVYLLALLSLDNIRRRLGRTSWWIIRTIAMNYIAFVFALDFFNVTLPLTPRALLDYGPFALLSIAGILLHALSSASSFRRAFSVP